MWNIDLARAYRQIEGYALLIWKNDLARAYRQIEAFVLLICDGPRDFESKGLKKFSHFLPTFGNILKESANKIKTLVLLIKVTHALLGQ